MKDALTFSTLEARIKQAMPATPVLNRRKAARRSLILGVVAAAAAVLLLGFGHPSWKEVGASIALGVELVAFTFYFGHEVRDELPRFRKSKEFFAKELDSDYVPYTDLLDWLRSHPMDELRRRLIYLRRRQSNMAGRLVLFMGPFEKLGILPLAVSVYLQVKDISSFGGINVWQGLFAWLLVFFYALGHWTIGLKLRLDLYADLLTAAIDDDRGLD